YARPHDAHRHTPARDHSRRRSHRRARGWPDRRARDRGRAARKKRRLRHALHRGQLSFAMSNVNSDRRVEGDWWTEPIPPSVVFGEGFYCESAQIFRHLRSKAPRAVVMGNHVSCYAGCSFSVGANGSCSVGDFTLLNGALVMAEERIEIGSHCLISWNVWIADSDFHPLEPAQRLIDAQALAPYFKDRPSRPKLKTAPVKIADNVWIGMNATILKGVRIGENSVVAAGSVVSKSVPSNTVVAGNPAVEVRQLGVIGG